MNWGLILVVAGIVLCAVALLAAVVSGFSAPLWVLPAGALAIGVGVLVGRYT